MIDERDKKILCAVVQSYINRPDPVGSRFITKQYSFSLSPATIRNVMSDLEDMGFLVQPHTSAGRVPTDKGYRFYVNSFNSMEVQTDTKAYIGELTKELESIKNDINNLIFETTKKLSNLSHYLGIAVSPKVKTATFNRVKLMKHRGNAVVAVLFTDEGLVNNKIIDMDLDLSQRDLNRIAMYLNSDFCGNSIEEIRSRIIKEMAKEKALCDNLIASAMKICKEILAFSDDDIFVSGLSEVVGLPDFENIKRIQEIFRAIEDKHLIVKLLDRLAVSDAVQVIIGSENSVNEMKKFSIIAKTYKQGNRPVGSVGVIGPTRMDYLKTIAIVDASAKFITKILSEK